MKNLVRWLPVAVVVIIVGVVLVMTHAEWYTGTDDVGAVVEKFCDKHYGRDKWFYDSINTFNEQLVFVDIRTIDGGQTSMSVLPQSRAIIIESTTSAKTPARHIHRF